MADRKEKSVVTKEISLSGKLITSIDSELIGNNFQKLQNMRYTDESIKSVSGQTHINTTALTSELKPRSGFHFKKSLPVESHVLIQMWNPAETSSKIKQNISTIPDVGDFESASLHSDATGSDVGRFSNAPIETLAYCNSKETMMWGGKELAVGRVINFDPDGTFEYDYSTVLRNQDQNDSAKLKTVASAVDTNLVLLLHCDGINGGTSFPDSSPTTPHTVTANGNAQTTTSGVKFGTAIAKFDGTGDYLSIPSDADFNLSGGEWTIDFQLSMSDLNTAGTNSIIYEHATDINNYMIIRADNPIIGIYGLQIKIVSAGATVVFLPSATSTQVGITHWAIQRSAGIYKIFKNGIEIGSNTVAIETSNYTGSVNIGSARVVVGEGDLDGKIDEFRISKVARYTGNFTPPTNSYSSSGTTSLYVGSLLPIQGIKFYVKNGNNTIANVNVQENTSSGFTNTSNQIDGTSVTGKSLAQTGTISFDSTVNTVGISVINGLQLFWYKVIFNGIDQDTEIYWVTLDTEFQPARDIWAGEPNSVLAMKHFDENSVFQDHTINVFKNEYDSNISSTFAPSFAGTTPSEYIVFGFIERQMALNINLSVGDTQTNTAGVTVKYWNGTDWIALGGVIDNTQTSGATWSKSGTISWVPPSIAIEFKTQVQNELPLYYYRVEFSAILSSTNIRPYYITGIPAPVKIPAFRFPLSAHNRLWYCNEINTAKNKVIMSARGTFNVFNGDDTLELFIGDSQPITAAAELYGQFSSNQYKIVLIAKENELWLIFGDSPIDWQVFPLSRTIGCVAPLTMTVFNIASAEGEKVMAVWQGSDGIWSTDGISLTRLDNDVKDIFIDQINPLRIADSKAFYDAKKEEWHWLWSSGSNVVHDQEYVLDVRRNRWFAIDRGVGETLQIGIPISDVSGNNYTYGGIDLGFLDRLENGTAFNLNDIVSKFRLGDAPLAGHFKESSIRYIKMPMRTKNITTNSAIMTHYGDSNNIASSEILTLSPVKVGRAVTSPTKHVNYREHIYHSLEASMTTDDEKIGFEPIALLIIYIIIRDNLNRS